MSDPMTKQPKPPQGEPICRQCGNAVPAPPLSHICAPILATPPAQAAASAEPLDIAYCDDCDHPLATDHVLGKCQVDDCGCIQLPFPPVMCASCSKHYEVTTIGASAALDLCPLCSIKNSLFHYSTAPVADEEAAAPLPKAEAPLGAEAPFTDTEFHKAETALIAELGVSWHRCNQMLQVHLYKPFTIESLRPEANEYTAHFEMDRAWKLIVQMRAKLHHAAHENATLRAQLAKAQRDLARFTERRFPLLLQRGDDYGDCPNSIPWSAIAPYEASAERNHDQNLETLAKRGGLAPEELWCVVNNKQLSRNVFKERAVALVKQMNQSPAERQLSVVREALRSLYEETADYIRVNNLGDVHHNASMKQAEAALSSTGASTTITESKKDDNAKKTPPTP